MTLLLHLPISPISFMVFPDLMSTLANGILIKNIKLLRQAIKPAQYS